MPLFFSLSGYLYYFSVKKYSLKTLVKKKSKRLLIPYFIICFLWMDPIKILLSVPSYNISLHLFKEQIIGLNNGHLWFLYTLFAIFILFKTLYSFKFLSRKGGTIIFFILSLLCNIYSYKFTIFSNVCSYTIYFYIGFLINKNSTYVNSYKTKIISVSIFFSVLSILLSLNDLIKYNILTLIIAIFILVILYSIDLEYIAKNSLMKIIGDNSFGIYLFHSPLIYITFTYWKNINPILVFVMNFLIFGSIALVISLVLKKSHMKFIIGE